MNVLRSLAFYLLFYGASPLFVIATLLSKALVPGEHFRAWPNAWSRFHRWCVVHVLRIEVRVEGEPIAEQAIYALKHESFFEAIDLGTLFDMPVPFGKEELYRIPGWGRAALAYGSVPVYRDSGAKGLRKMLSDARKFVGSGRPFCILPEGTRVPHGTRPPLRSGFAGLYKLLGLPVVPVAIDSGPTYHRLWKRRGTITVRFMKAIPAGLPREEIEARVHQAINALND
ncbi:lysophospholipid acyltransferase family protein [Croceibacterium aestuarii]|uniref:lysophospholipid acyltransferase family protein n=1 Tax=Croceibacterium aestuarii TaxID=3064139 RepID=UPI00272EBB31|nr:lysophospholipid acyltransferase family protein [Croceibacterium sp. D39]